MQPRYAGKPTEGLAFYDLLFTDEEFCSEMGRVALASSQLEAELTLLLASKRVPERLEGKTLGALSRLARKHKSLDENTLSALDDLCWQRNYLTHNIYALFIGLIEETRLDRSNLLDSDVQTYTERAWQLRKNLAGVAKIIARSRKSEPPTTPSVA